MSGKSCLDVIVITRCNIVQKFALNIIFVLGCIFAIPLIGNSLLELMSTRWTDLDKIDGVGYNEGLSR